MSMYLIADEENNVMNITMTAFGVSVVVVAAFRYRKDAEAILAAAQSQLDAPYFIREVGDYIKEVLPT